MEKQEAALWDKPLKTHTGCPAWSVISVPMFPPETALSRLSSSLAAESLFPLQIFSLGEASRLGSFWLAGKDTKSLSFLQNSALSVDIFQCLGTDLVTQAELLLVLYFIALLVKLKHSVLCLSTSHDVKARLTWR